MLTETEKRIIKLIQKQTVLRNLDNISRTIAYETFYFQYKEIKWALLAAFVSRNAGWNMCDLEGEWFRSLLSDEYRASLFLTYERANWYIFQDAYPQLLLYHYSTILKRPLFHLLSYFFVSDFMIREWNGFEP